MSIGHQEIIVPDHSLRPFQGAGIDRRVFADLVAVTYLEITHTTFKFPVLGAAADHGARKDLIVRTNRGMSLDRHARAYLRAIPDLHRPFNKSPRSDLHVPTQNSIRMDNGGRMDHSRSTTANFTSASHTSLSPT